MSIAKILVPIFGSKNDAAGLATAFAAAKPFAAHVQVLFTRPDPQEAIAVMGMPLSGNLVQALIDSQERVTATAVRHARAALATEAEKAGVRIVAEPHRGDAVTASYREETGRLGHVLEGALRFCDLVVFPPGTETNPDLHDVLVGILTRAQRPVLLAPATAPAQVGSKITLGWDGSMTAAHALTAALSYLRNAEALTLVAVGRKPHEESAQEARQYLALHGMKACIRSVEPGTRGIAETLLETAATRNSDLLVIGGYGHSHLRETIFGGVTQHVISHATVPVFLAH